MSVFVHFVHAKMELRIYSSIILEPIIKSTFQIPYFFSGQLDKTQIPFIIQKHQNHNTSKCLTKSPPMQSTR